MVTKAPEVVLYAYPGFEELESASPYALKVIYALKYLDIPYLIEWVGAVKPKQARRGRIPVALIRGEIVEDSTNILKAIDGMHSLPYKLYPEMPAIRSQTLLLEDWCDESLVMNVVYYRWAVDANFRTFSRQCFASMAPWLRALLGPMIRRRVMGRIATASIFVLPEAERRARFQEQMQALSSMLETRDFLCAVKPTAADFAVYACLRQILVSRIPELSPMILQDQTLQAWLDRMTALTATERASHLRI